MVPSGRLLLNLILFGRVLRGLGLRVTPERMVDLALALRHVEVGNRSDFYYAARAMLVLRREDLALFEAAFEMFWQAPFDRQSLDETRRRQNRRSTLDPLASPTPSRGSHTGSTSEDAPQATLGASTRTYSAQEMLRERDFASLSENEIDAVRRLIDDLVWTLGEKWTRRQRPGGRRRLDMRRTLRRSLRHGEVLDWAHCMPRTKPRSLVVICDVSGSMERYTRLLLHFVHSLTQGLGRRVEAFAFGTRLTRLSRQLGDRDIERALSGVSVAVLDWSGGTRIGECLRVFNRDWGRRVLGGGAAVLLISDGWDWGEPELLAGEMEHLRRSCSRLIWLNPLLGSPDYEPLTRGMRAALPFVDDFLPVHNLASLEHLARRLSTLDSTPVRRRPSHR